MVDKKTPKTDEGLDLAQVNTKLNEELERLRAEIGIYKDQISSLERFANIVVGQRNEAQTEVARLMTQLTKENS